MPSWDSRGSDQGPSGQPEAPADMKEADYALLSPSAARCGPRSGSGVL